ncbi:chemotaxis protein CheW [Xylophilus rhododendri]|uniref:Chemotaxis protein CheW n=1 Tax=Xylophilus rhododendri TaxID=2697032 RepID=A0A857J3N6_9BURK|nr:chemotaxis protein CheW [Xylophilus rhododendri]QHI98277.1 chemotaxis protein CheW [Xylophilus rhododendri]
MANRQALRELQSRLASRLQAARDEGPSLVWLAAEAGGARLLFPLSQAGEIFPWTPVQPVPYAAPWFRGVANLRGALAGVVDLARFTDGEVSGPPAGPLTAEASLLSLNALLGVPCALVIDRLLGLRGGEAFVAAEPRGEQAPAWHGAVYTDARQQRWQEIDLQALAAHPSFLSIAA